MRALRPGTFGPGHLRVYVSLCGQTDNAKPACDHVTRYALSRARRCPTRGGTWYSRLQFDSSFLKKRSEDFVLTCGARHRRQVSLGFHNPSGWKVVAVGVCCRTSHQVFPTRWVA